MGIELLAPVGSLEAFKSALDNGANAIYLAGVKFGAREKATFTNEELVDIIKEAHINEVKVYVTVNTLIYDDELEDVLKFIDFLYNNDCDAVIVQDLGLITLIHSIYPDFVIHASTQMNTMTLRQARILKDMGVKRIVVARETSAELIKRIIDEVQIEVEVFIHGALCVSYSGQCLFSSCLLKKSGNRGECLQLCRLPYSLYKENEKLVDNQYLLSMKDLNTIHYIKELLDANITSLKIEGRLKSGSYVGIVTSAYRKYIDKYINENNFVVDKQDYKNLKQVFNREFTKGYLFNENNNDITNHYRPNNMGIRIGKVIDVRNNKVFIKLDDTLNQGDGIRIVGKDDVGFYVNMMEVNRLLVKEAYKGQIVTINVREKVDVNSVVYKTSDVKLNEDVKNNSIRRKFPIKAYVEAFVGCNLKINFIDNLNNNVEVVSEYKIIKANNSPTSKEKIVQQLSKLNETNYYLDGVEIEGDDMVLIPVSIINEMRRVLVEKLNEKRSKINIRTGRKKLSLNNVLVDSEDFNLKVKVSNDTQYKVAKEYLEDDHIYFNKQNTIYSYPRISENRIEVHNDMVLINELHDIDIGKEMIANYYLNCTNIFALYTLYKLGFKRVTLSVEMTKTRVYNLISNYKKYFNANPNIELVIYSKIDLFVSKYCLINKCLGKDRKECGECLKSKYFLEDRKGYKIPLVKDYFCNLRLLNPRALMLLEYVEDMKDHGVNCVRIEFSNEEENDCYDILNSYMGQEIELDSRKFTYGYFKEKEEC
jgi:putative protease